jgi:hypothetical protein
MAVDPNINKSVQETAKVVEQAFKDISSQVRDIFEQSLGQTNKFSDSIVANINKGIRDIGRSAETFESNLNKLNRGSLTQAEVQKQIEARANKIKALEMQSVIATNKKTKGMSEVNKELKKAIAYESKVVEQLLEQSKQAAEIEKKIGNTGKLLQKVSKIPVLGNLIDAEEALERAQKEAAKAGSTSASVMKVAFSSLGGTLRTSLVNPLTSINLSVDFLRKAVKYALEFNETQIKTSKALLINAEAAKSLTESFQDLARDSNNAYINYVKLSKANIELNDVLGTNVQLTAKQLEDNIQLKEVAGLEADERAAIYKFSNLTGKTQEEIFNSIGKQNKGVLSNKKVLSEVLKTSGQLAAQYKNNPVLLAQAVIQAQRLGMTLEKTKQVSSQLLNFEDSISAELEAELLTGQDLNLEKARYLALQGDSAGAAKELLANMGPNGLAKFQKMNVIQQESLARALGMGVDELADTLVKQNQLNKMTVDQRKEYEKNVELAKMERDERTKTAENIENLKKIFFSFTNGPIAYVIKGFNSILEGINGSPILKSIIGFAGGAAALLALGAGLVGAIRLLSGVFSKGAIPVTVVGGGGISDSGGSITGSSGGSGKGIGSNLKNLFKGGRAGKLARGRTLQGLGKGLTKKIPYVGAAIGLASEIAEGGLNWESIGRATLSGGGAALGGLLGTIGGLGAASVPLGIAGGIGGGMAGDKLGDMIFGERTPMARGGIVSKPTRALVGESGTEAVIPLDKFYAKMDELINVIKQGGNVYLDGNKVGTSMSVGTYRTQ